MVDPEREVEVRISELIERLKTKLAQNGDLCVCILDADEECLLALPDRALVVKKINDVYGDDWPETQKTKGQKVLLIESDYEFRYYGER